MRFVAPLDKEILHKVFTNFRHIITIEDGVLSGGFGSAVVEFMSDYGYSADVRRLGIDGYFVEHGTQDELYRECGFDAEGIEIAIREMVVKIEGKNSV
jgi:1-deoxy-D-xylulose-5-phosphate synthase